MSMQINTSGWIILNDKDTGLGVTQNGDGTIVFKRETSSQKYQTITMPHARYSLAHDAPRPIHKTPELAAKYPSPAGRTQFEADIKSILGM